MLNILLRAEILRIKGRMGEAFLVADLKLVVLLEDSFEEKGRNK